MILQKLSQMTIAQKLPLMIVGAGGMVGICVGVAAYLSAAASLEHEAKARLGGLLESHKTSLETYISSVEQDLRFVANNITVRSAVSQLTRGWKVIKDNPTEILQRLYIEENPHPTGQKETLDAADDGSPYSKLHARYHPWFRQFLRERGYSDIFLFDTDGNLIYSVFKEFDFATNLVSGRWRDTDLGKAFRKVRENPTKDYQAFFDFRAYGPSQGVPASFVATPVLDKRDNLLGVLAFRMPMDRVNNVLEKARGLGTTGETYLVGQDLLMRSDSRFAEQSTILTRRVDMEAVKRALDGGHDVMSDLDADGQSVIAAFAPLDFGSVRWAIIGQMAEDEIMAPASTLAWRIVGITTAALLFLSVLGWVLARGIVRPLEGMVNAVASMIKGDTVQVPGDDRNDEIGVLARSMDTVYQKGLEAVRLRSALDGCSTMVLVANRHCQTVYVNHALEGFFIRNESAIQSDLPGFTASSLTGMDIGMLGNELAEIKKTAETLQSTTHLDTTLGSCRLQLAVSPVFKESGTFLGLVIEWVDATIDLAIQGEIDRVIAAARQGEFDQQIDLQGVEGVNRNLADGMNQLTKVIATATDELGTMLEAMAGGDLGKRIDVDFQGRLGDLKNHANRTADQLSATVAEIQTVTSEVKSAASEISSGTSDLSERTEQAAANLEETAASTEQMSATVRQNAENAKNAHDLTNVANQTASKGGQVVEQAVGAMSGIDNSAQKITGIIGVIDEIAFQTNLLALNASVEAARAGEAGKGFAVVAQEVRLLAQRSAEAASDIKALIQESNSQVKDGVRLVNQAGDALSEIVGSIGRVTGIVQGISSASQEQAVGVQEITTSIASMDEMTQQNSALVEESTAAARALSEQAGKLAELMAFFKLDNAAAPTLHPSTARQQPSPSRPPVRPRTKVEPLAKTPPAMATTDEDSWNEF